MESIPSTKNWQRSFLLFFIPSQTLLTHLYSFTSIKKNIFLHYFSYTVNHCPKAKAMQRQALYIDPLPVTSVLFSWISMRWRPSKRLSNVTAMALWAQYFQLWEIQEQLRCHEHSGKTVFTLTNMLKMGLPMNRDRHLQLQNLVIILFKYERTNKLFEAMFT